MAIALLLTLSSCPAQNEPGGKVGTEPTGLRAGRAAVGMQDAVQPTERTAC